ncbi:MAG: hypothetical protein D6710_01825 [Nitrospirae bacterium]|nr:MAG: hypothetical protein D6710_01825 [Nitrospirota bacterium]
MRNKITIAALLAITGMIGATACATLDPQDNLVITTPEHLSPEANIVPGDPMSDATVVDVDMIADEGLRDVITKLFGEDTTTVVVTTKEFLTNDTGPYDYFPLSIPTAVNPETGEPEVDRTGLITSIARGIGALAPPAAQPFLGLGGFLLASLFRKRPRQHLARATKALVPVDGKIDLAGAATYTAKALGWSHSTEDPDELMKIAERKKLKKELETKA